MAWYRDFQSSTSNSRTCLAKLRLLPKMTSSSIVPREVAASPGTTPYIVVPEFFQTDRGINILCRVLVKIMFRLLPPPHEDSVHIVASDLGVEDQGCMTRPWDC